MTPEERIDRYLLGQANSEDIEILNELLQRDEALRQAYRFRVALEGGCREAALRDSSVTSNPDPATQLPDWRFSWLHPAAAATVMVLAVIWFIGNQIPETIATTDSSGYLTKNSFFRHRDPPADNQSDSDSANDHDSTLPK